MFLSWRISWPFSVCGSSISRSNHALSSVRPSIAREVRFFGAPSEKNGRPGLLLSSSSFTSPRLTASREPSLGGEERRDGRGGEAPAGISSPILVGRGFSYLSPSYLFRSTKREMHRGEKIFLLSREKNRYILWGNKMERRESLLLLPREGPDVRCRGNKHSPPSVPYICRREVIAGLVLLLLTRSYLNDLPTGGMEKEGILPLHLCCPTSICSVSPASN